MYVVRSVPFTGYLKQNVTRTKDEVNPSKSFKGKYKMISISQTKVDDKSILNLKDVKN